jgi:hypothetical protein
MAPAQEPVSLFYSYSHKDAEFRDRLQEALAVLKRQGLISQWHDGQIGAGTEWSKEISDHLEHAEVILLLMSPSFLASDPCYAREMTRALERHEANSARVIPVIVRPCEWKETSVQRLQALPKEGKAVTQWPNLDEAFLDITQGIRRAIGHLRPR